MSAAAIRIDRLYGCPGAMFTAASELRSRVAAAHGQLLQRAADCASTPPNAALKIIIEALDRSRRPTGRAPKHRCLAPLQRQRLLCHPLMIEGMHALADSSPALRAWHEAVAPPAPHSGRRPGGPAAALRLGTTALILLLRHNPAWRGRIDLSTDAFGRLRFPFCDWSIALQHADDRDAMLGNRIVNLSMDQHEARWHGHDEGHTPFLVMDRDDCTRALAHNDERLELARLRFPDPAIRVRLQFARPFRGSPIRYDAVGFQDFKAHAGVTGGLMEALLEAMRANSPGVYREMRAFIHSVRGFELGDSAMGVVESFSDPTLPGVMGVNIAYTPEHEPCFNPLFFMNLGHELGHTRNYLVDAVLHVAGEALVLNAGERSGIVERYGRALSMRTIFQIPYVHLYEWVLLMDFAEAGFRGLPWDVECDWHETGDDVASEIAEAFEMIDRGRAGATGEAGGVRLTALGVAAMQHFRDLYERAMLRWQRMK